MSKTTLSPKRLNGFNANLRVTKQPTATRGGGVEEAVVVVEKPVIDRSRVKSPVNYSIKRESSNIAGIVLPFCMFDPVDRDQNYISVFQKCNVFPAGGVVVFSIDGTNGDGLFTWTVAGKTDVIRIHSTGLVPYSSQLKMIEIGGNFTTSGIRYGFDRTAFPNQPSSIDLFTGNSEFVGIGLESSDNINSLVAPDQFQLSIIDIAIEMGVDPCEFLVHGLQAGAAVGDTNTINWSFFDVNYQSGAIFSRGYNCG